MNLRTLIAVIRALAHPLPLIAPIASRLATALAVRVSKSSNIEISMLDAGASAPRRICFASRASTASQKRRTGSTERDCCAIETPIFRIS